MHWNFGLTPLYHLLLDKKHTILSSTVNLLDKTDNLFQDIQEDAPTGRSQEWSSEEQGRVNRRNLRRRDCMPRH